MKRKRIYGALERELLAEEDSICQQMGRVMASFKPGLFAGGGRADLPRDNLDLERWFRLPKGHERRIHGVVMPECASCKKARRCCWPWTHIGITQSHSPKKNFVPIVRLRLLRVRKKRSGDAR